MNRTQIPEHLRQSPCQRVGFLARPAFLAWAILCLFIVSFLFSASIFSQAVIDAESAQESQKVADERKAETVLFNKTMHPWGQFEPGAWRMSKTCVETFASNVSSNNITCTENSVTLQKSDAADLTLLSESFLNLAGKNIKTEPRLIHQGFHGLDAAEFTKHKTLRAESLVVDGQPVACEVAEYEFADEKSKKTITLWVNGAREPYIFRKEIRIINLKDSSLEEYTVSEITSMNQQVVALGRIYNGYQTRAESRFPQRTVNTVTLSSVQVPGGVISRVSREKNAKGRMLQVATTELMDFGRNMEEHQNELLRGNPIRVAGGAAFRPTVPAGVVAGRPKVLQVTLNFSHETTSQRNLPGGVPESYEYLRFRDRLWKNRGKTSPQQVAGDQESGTPGFMETVITVKGSSLRDSSVPGMVTLSPDGPQVDEEEAVEGTDDPRRRLSIFAKSDSAHSAVDRKAQRQAERKSPLYQLSKKEVRKRQRAEMGKAVTMAEADGEMEHYADQNTGFIDLSITYDQQDAARENTSMPRGSWRRHWRAVIFGENDGGAERDRL